MEEAKGLTQRLSAESTDQSTFYKVEKLQPGRRRRLGQEQIAFERQLLVQVKRLKSKLDFIKQS